MKWNLYVHMFLSRSKWSFSKFVVQAAAACTWQLPGGLLAALAERGGAGETYEFWLHAMYYMQCYRHTL